jgi:acyl-CoA synthetase
MITKRAKPSELLSDGRQFNADAFDVGGPGADVPDAYSSVTDVKKAFRIRRVDSILAARYRAEGLWTERTLSQELEAGLIRNADLNYRVWSDTRPFAGAFSVVHRRALSLAQSFKQLGVAPGDVVSFQLPNWIEAVECFLATIFAGAVSMPIVHIYGPKELRFVLGQTATKLHVTVSSFRRLPYREYMESMARDLPDLEHVIYIDQNYDRLLAAAPLEKVFHGSPDEPAILGYTSGTTADPKGVIHTHRTVIAEMRQRIQGPAGDQRSVPLEMPDGYRNWLVASPLGHVSGLQTGVLMPVMLDRSGNLIDNWDIETVLAALSEAGLTLGGAANFFFSSLLNHPKFRPEHVRHIRYIGSGGAPVPRSFGERCAQSGISVVRCYGSTEHPSMTGSAYDDPQEKRIGTDGRMLAGVEIQIRDGHGQPVKPGTPGEIHSRGPDLFVGYTDSQLNEAAFDEDGWFHTGDVGVLDADGYLTITDRTKDIIIRGGENISAAEVEEALLKLPNIVEAAAVAAPDARMGEHVCAFLRVKPGATPPSFIEMQAHMQTVGIARQKWPEELRVVSDFERTASGKIKKFILRELLGRESGTKISGATHKAVSGVING